MRWKRDRTTLAFSYSTPRGRLPTTAPLRWSLNSSRGVEAFDPSTGAPLGEVLEDNRFPIPMPVQHQDVLYLSRGYRSSPYLAIRLGGKGDVTKTHVVWHMLTCAVRLVAGVPRRPSLHGQRDGDRKRD